MWEGERGFSLCLSDPQPCLSALPHICTVAHLAWEGIEDNRVREDEQEVRDQRDQSIGISIGPHRILESETKILP